MTTEYWGLVDMGINTVQVNEEEALKAIDDLANKEDREVKKEEMQEAKEVQVIESADNDPGAWLNMSGTIVNAIDAGICPEWNLKPDEKEGLTSGIAETLDYYFPGSLEGFDNWSPGAKLAFTIAMIAITRFDMRKMKFQPMRAIENDATEKGRREANSDNGENSERENGKRFTTSGYE